MKEDRPSPNPLPQAGEGSECETAAARPFSRLREKVGMRAFL
jgi:hypothetical protein